MTIVTGDSCGEWQKSPENSNSHQRTKKVTREQKQSLENEYSLWANPVNQNHQAFFFHLTCLVLDLFFGAKHLGPPTCCDLVLHATICSNKNTYFDYPVLYSLYPTSISTYFMQYFFYYQYYIKWILEDVAVRVEIFCTPTATLIACKCESVGKMWEMWLWG